MQSHHSIITLATLASACAASTEQLPGSRQQQAIAAPAPGRSPERLDALLARWDAAGDRDDRRALAARVDAVAGQRYATVSRLYWHTELDAALAASRESGKPVLSLRMLGRLDEDYSCANSRFFRVALYANKKVSRFLRDNYILHWSSERPVPKVTVDYGDGRVMHRTIAGNSAHYVLDSRGRPIDVLPGLYGPRAFVSALSRSLPLARRAGDLDEIDLAPRLAAYHRERRGALARSWKALGPVTTSGGRRIGDAEMTAPSKAAVEMPMVAVMLGEPLDRMRWNAIVRARLAAPAGRDKLDPSSRRLFAALAPVRGRALAELIARFEQGIAIDTQLNEYGIHYQIHAWLADPEGPPSFEKLNRRVYDELFLTPATDPWLGMSVEGTFTGLPGDGIARQ